MKGHEAIARLCTLVSKMGEQVFKNKAEHDCFCAHGCRDTSAVVVHEDVIKYIEQAVETAMGEDMVFRRQDGHLQIPA